MPSKMKTGEKILALPVMALIATIFGMVACADDTLDISVNVQYDSSAQTVINEALQDPNSALGVRMMYTYPSRVVAGNQVVSVRPTTAIPVEGPRWETSQSQGFDFLSTDLTLQGVPLGNTSTEIYIEILRKGAFNLWYPIAYSCIKQWPGVTLTEDRLKQINGQTITMSKGRTCGGCNPPVTFTDYDDDRCN